MKHDDAFYRARIEQAESEIAVAKLGNVRDQAVRARNQWLHLAEQHEKALAERTRAARIKAERAAA